MRFMEFCEKCGRLLIVTDNFAKCACGFIKKANIVSSNERIEKPIKRGKGIAEEKESKKGFPHKCKKCRHEFVDVIDLGVFYSDESSIYLFKCKKCGNTERDAYGSSNA